MFCTVFVSLAKRRNAKTFFNRVVGIDSVSKVLDFILSADLDSECLRKNKKVITTGESARCVYSLSCLSLCCTGPMYFCVGSNRTRVLFNNSAVWTTERVYRSMKKHMHVQAIAVELPGSCARVFITSPEELWFASRLVAAYMEGSHSDAEMTSRTESLDDLEHTERVEQEVAASWRTRSDSDGGLESESE
jgi:hypothetical protein